MQERSEFGAAGETSYAGPDYFSPDKGARGQLGQEKTPEPYLPSEAEPYPQVSAKRGEETAPV